MIAYSYNGFAKIVCELSFFGKTITELIFLLLIRNLYEYLVSIFSVFMYVLDFCSQKNYFPSKNKL